MRHSVRSSQNPDCRRNEVPRGARAPRPSRQLSRGRRSVAVDGNRAQVRPRVPGVVGRGHRLVPWPSAGYPEQAMIAHTSLAVRDYRKSKAFYTQALAPLGYTNNMEYGEAAGFNDGKNTDFWISRQKTTVPMHVAFE